MLTSNLNFNALFIKTIFEIYSISNQNQFEGLKFKILAKSHSPLVNASDMISLVITCAFNCFSHNIHFVGLQITC